MEASVDWIGFGRMPLFAEDIVGIGAFAGIAGGIVTLLGGIWVVVRQFNKDRAETKTAEKKDALSELQGILATYRTDFAEFKTEARIELAKLERELEDQRALSHDCDRKTDRMSSQIFYLESVMKKAGLDFVPWVQVEDETGPKAALKPTKDAK